MKGRARPFTSAKQRIRCPQTDTPLDGAAPEQPSATTLADQEPGEGGPQTKNPADHESTLAADFDFDPASRRRRAA